MVELNSTDVIQVSKKGKKASMQLIVPDLDLVIITSRDEERLRFMEMNAADRAIVLVEPVNQRPHPVIPELDYAAVETRKDPWPLSVKAKPLDPVALRLEFRQHRPPRDLLKP